MKEFFFLDFNSSFHISSQSSYLYSIAIYCTCTLQYNYLLSLIWSFHAIYVSIGNTTTHWNMTETEQTFCRGLFWRYKWGTQSITRDIHLFTGLNKVALGRTAKFMAPTSWRAINCDCDSWVWNSSILVQILFHSWPFHLFNSSKSSLKYTWGWPELLDYS